MVLFSAIIPFSFPFPCFCYLIKHTHTHTILRAINKKVKATVLFSAFQFSLLGIHLPPPLFSPASFHTSSASPLLLLLSPWQECMRQHVFALVRQGWTGLSKTGACIKWISCALWLPQAPAALRGNLTYFAVFPRVCYSSLNFEARRDQFDF